ncbi:MULTISPECIES: DUF429 domain-containing protein [unclassified Spirosoma]|uniref:DUF429 domain-containing protein n=1 Tax=unclassified Spirosoma TaxID=2621999 RepID=UPI00095B8ECD|nr:MULTISPECIES: DUF429 domain-containing protein [unclassified Spirosoma]MBN8821874.1 DUF429 domain-containing protein [Spirosoma sp.]OJW80642.1 MAG: hypothetical protein BGO59_34820 [Spirosoma sp. 48-14]
MYVGIDGCRGGWLVAIIDQEASLHHCMIRSLNELQSIPVKLALIDIPLHFADTSYRICEVAAQALLGVKRASIFFTPHRAAVYAATYAEANRLNRLYTDKGVSKQTWNICAKIREANQFLGDHPDYSIREAHPELCFYYLNQRQPLLSKKSTPQGAADRLGLIARHAESYPQVIENTLKITKRKDVKVDDVIDATILAIRASDTNLQCVPENRPFDKQDVILY